MCKNSLKVFGQKIWKICLKLAFWHYWHVRPIIICNGVGVRDCSDHLREFGSICGLYPLIPVTTFLSCNNPECLQTLPNVPWGTKLSLLENHLLRVNINSSQFNVFYMTRTTLSDNGNTSPHVLQAHKMPKIELFHYLVLTKAEKCTILFYKKFQQSL